MGDLMIRKNVVLLRAAYWTGAVADFFFFVAMIYPPLWGLVFGKSDFSPGLEYRIDMGVGASLMLGWTFLLLWADRRPVERRGVLLLTAFPVLVGLGITGSLAAATGTTSALSLAPVFVLKITLLTLMISAYLAAGRLAREEDGNSTHSSGRG